MRFGTLTSNGYGRLFLLIIVAWVVVWGSVFAYSSYRTTELGRDIDYESERLELVANQPGKEIETKMVLDGIGYANDRQMVTLTWADRAMWTGPIGLALILFIGFGGMWVYRGFRKPTA